MEFKVIDLFKNYLKNLMLALLVLALSLIFSYYYLFNVYEPAYTAKTTVMLGANNNKTDIGFNQSVINNYLELVKSKNLLEKTITKTKLDYTSTNLINMINVFYEEDTEFITIEVTTKNQEDSAKLSYAIYEELVEEVERVFKTNNIHLIDTDNIGTLKYSNNLLLIVVIIVSLFLSFISTTINYLFFPSFNLQESVRKLRKQVKEKISTKKTPKNKKAVPKNEVVKAMKTNDEKEISKVVKKAPKKVSSRNNKINSQSNKKPTSRKKKVS